MKDSCNHRESFYRETEEEMVINNMVNIGESKWVLPHFARIER